MKPTSSLRSVRACQRGAATIIIAMLLTLILVAAVLGMLTMAGSSVMDAGTNSQQISALFLAESGLERGQAVVSTAYPITDSVCTGIAGGPFSLGGTSSFSLTGTSYAYGSTTPNTPCDNSSATICSKCVISATGNVGTNTRTISRTLSLTTLDGTTCNAATAVPDCTNATANPPTVPPTWQMVLRNPYAHNAIALFNLSFLRQGNPSGASCTHTGCALMWNIDASNGSNSDGGMGNAVTIPSGSIFSIYQTLTLNRDLAEVGALFPGTGANGPSIVGSVAPSIANARAYWDDTNPNGGGSKTVGRAADSQGKTNNGTANTVTSCSSPGPNSNQTCDNWCLAGDMLVFGFSAHSDSGLTDTLHTVLFNTAGSPSQNISLTRLAKFPNSTIPGAPNDVYSEIWYAHNPDYLSIASSAYSGGAVTGSIGATYTSLMGNNSNVMTTSSQIGVLHVGDTVVCSGGSGSCPAFLPATIQTVTVQNLALGTGTYTLNGTCSNPRCNSFSGKSTGVNLDVTAFASGYLSVGDTLTGPSVPLGTTITSIVGAGNVLGLYGTSIGAATILPPTAITSNGNTIHVNGGTVPASGIPAVGTIVAVNSGAGTGVFAADTTVLAAPAPTATLYKVSAVPSTRVSGATICGGTCAFFDQTSATTTFAIDKSTAPGTDNWAAGFMCLTGADITPIPVTSSTIQATNWYEAVR